jgi:hypothetical protein
MSQSIVRAAVNNAILDPIQGFDADVYIQDQATGQQLMIGRFTSFQTTIRNATEPYMEMNQRIPRLLDGEFQFGWVLERGLIDVRDLPDNTFGLSYLGRELRLSRSPRWQITVEIDAPELDQSGTTANSSSSNASALLSQETFVGASIPSSRTSRDARGAYRLIYCKPDSMTLGIMAGRSVIATRWEGLCEGVFRVDVGSNSSSNAGTTLGAAVSGGSLLGNNSIPTTFGSVSTSPDWGAAFGTSSSAA